MVSSYNINRERDLSKNRLLVDNYEYDIWRKRIFGVSRVLDINSRAISRRWWDYMLVLSVESNDKNQQSAVRPAVRCITSGYLSRTVSCLPSRTVSDSNTAGRETVVTLSVIYASNFVRRAQSLGPGTVTSRKSYIADRPQPSLLNEGGSREVVEGNHNFSRATRSTIICKYVIPSLKVQTARWHQSCNRSLDHQFLIHENKPYFKQIVTVYTLYSIYRNFSQ